MSVITLRDPTTIYNSQNRLFRDGVELEKGVVIAEDFLKKNEEFLEKELNLFTVYPLIPNLVFFLINGFSCARSCDIIKSILLRRAQLLNHF